MKAKLSIQIINEHNELLKVRKKMDSFYSLHNLSPKIQYAVDLSIDEILTNIINYAFKDHEIHQINIQLHLSSTELILNFEDDGIPFNPLELEAPDTQSPLEERPIGGLGIHLVRNFMDGIKYSYQNNKNYLTLEKKIV